jgi:2-(3-amino-3-carboxypropyl)histidine synthase
MNNISKLAKKVRSTKAKRVLLQVPEGLKTRFTEIAEAIDADVFLSTDPCFGACDLRNREAEMLGCDLIVHVGHTKFYKPCEGNVPVLYFPWEVPVRFSEEQLKKIPEQRIGLLATAQHMSSLPKLKEMIENMGKKAVIGGQVLGCWAANADKIKNKTDALLLVGSGNFHALGLDKKIYVYDVERNIVRTVEEDKLKREKKRYANIEKARNAKTFGILVTSKPGQFDLQKAEDTKKRLEKGGKKAYIFVMDEIRDDRLLGLKIDAFINCACPRIVEDSFHKPVVNAKDVDKVLS